MNDKNDDNSISFGENDNTVKSKKSRSSTKSLKIPASNPTVQQMESEDISISQLELLANKKKLNKKSDITISERKSDLIKSATENAQPKRSKNDRRDSSTSLSSSSLSETQKKYKEKTVKRENKNDDIRKEKSEMLYKFTKLNIKGKWSSLKLDMNSTLDEIKNEYERVRNEIQNERSVAFFKRMLLLGVQGVEMLNTKFDPVGVDLDGWSEALGYSLENQEYDEVLAELYEKYKGKTSMSPEMKLVFMIISSATMFTITKKITKMDSSNVFKNLLGSFVGTNGADQQQQYQQQYQQQQYQQQQYQQQQYQQQFNSVNIPSPSQLNASDTSEDFQPSKMKGPSNDNIDIKNILNLMNKKNNDAQAQGRQQDDATSDAFRSIPLANQTKKRRGRPKKQVDLERL